MTKPDYELQDAAFMEFTGLDPNEFTLPRYWAILGAVGLLQAMKNADEQTYHRLHAERLAQLRLN